MVQWFKGPELSLQRPGVDPWSRNVHMPQDWPPRTPPPQKNLKAFGLEPWTESQGPGSQAKAMSDGAHTAPW